MLIEAKLTAPEETNWNVIFFWDHLSDSFRFIKVL
jgi:hypothetical protein